MNLFAKRVFNYCQKESASFLFNLSKLILDETERKYL